MQKKHNRLIRILKANMYAYMITVIFLLVTAILITHTNMGVDREKMIIIIGIIISAFIAGADTTKGENKNGWRWGILGAAVYGMIYFLIALSTSKASLLLCTNSLVMACVMLGSGAVAGIVTINLKKK